MADEISLLSTKLISLWSTTNSVKPSFTTSTEMMSEDISTRPVVDVYHVARTDTFQGLGADSKNIETHLSVDVQSRNHTDTIAVRDELIRILDSLRKNRQITGYDLVRHDGGRFIHQQVGYEQFVIDVTLIKLFQSL